jgi:hypothetical protein
MVAIESQHENRSEGVSYLEHDTWRVCQSMLFSSRNVLGARTMHFPRDFSVFREVPTDDVGASIGGRAVPGGA